MKKRIYGFLLVLFIFTLFASCNKLEGKDENEGASGGKEITQNSAMESLSLGIQEEKALAVILNFPEEETLKKVKSLKTYENDDSEETLLLIPVENGTRLEVKTLEWDNQTLKETGTAYLAENTEDGYGLYLRAIRPEGAPLLKIVVKSPNGAQGEYLVAYNGKDGTPEMEIIQAE